jgi:hypothetical protein
MATLEKVERMFPETPFGRRAGIYLKRMRAGEKGRGEEK